MKRFMSVLFSVFLFVGLTFGQSLPISASTHVDMGLVSQTKILASKSIQWMMPTPEEESIIPLSEASIPALLKTGEWPLRTCLFFPFDGEVKGTWDFFARNNGEAFRNAAAAWLSENNLNTMIFLMNNQDENNRVSFFKDGYCTDADWKQCAILERWLKAGHAGGANLIPCMFCDGDSVIAKASMAQHEAYFRAALPFISPYCRAICIGLESTEYFDNAKMAQLIALAKKYTTLPVGTHMQWDRKSALPAGLDFMLYEHSWHPVLGDNKTVAECKAEASQAISAAAKYGVAVGFVEYNLNPSGARIREQSRALAGLNGCVMVGGPQ